MEGERRYGISRAGLLSLVTFAWVGPLIKWGAVRELTLGDGKRLVAEKDEAGVLSSRFDKWWAKATEGAERDEAGQPKHPSRVFLAALFRTHWVKLLSQALWLLLESSLRLTSRVVLRMFLTWLTATQLSDAAAPEWKGWVLVAALSVLALAQAIVHHQMAWVGTRMGLHMRTQSVLAVHAKVLRLNSTSVADFSVGKVVNLVSNDASRFDEALLFLPFLVVAPLELLAVIGMLAYELGWLPALCGAASLLILVPFQACLSTYIYKLRAESTKVTDGRVRLTGEIISGALAMKMHSWEYLMSDKLKRLRSEEAHHKGKTAQINAGNFALQVALTPIITLATFAAAMATSVRLDVATVFYAVALLHLPKQYIATYFVDAVKHVTELRVAVKRIAEFLCLPEPPPAATSPTSAPPEDSQLVLHKTVNPLATGLAGNGGGEEENEEGVSCQGGSNEDGGVAVALQGGDYSWDNWDGSIEANLVAEDGVAKEDIECITKVALSGVTVTVSKGELIGICGETGAGKSSLLAALLGEMQPIGGSGGVWMSGTTAYCSQVPWVMAGTVEDNILFGAPKEEQRYKLAVSSAALTGDLSNLDAGDKTELGERGINLSGGQKARVALARAAYSNADVLLLDDPLSAVDAKVGRHIFHKCIANTGMMAGTTRLLVTHQKQYFPKCDRILVLREGRMIALGTWEEVAQLDLPELHGVHDVQASIDDDMGEGEEHQQEEEQTAADEGEQGVIPAAMPRTFSVAVDMGMAAQGTPNNNDKQHSTASDLQRTTSSNALGDAGADSGGSSRRLRHILSTRMHHPGAKTKQSVETPAAEESTKAGVLVKEEGRAAGALGWTLYWEYIQYCGLLESVVIMLAMIAGAAVWFYTQFWVGLWGASPVEEQREPYWLEVLGIFTAICIVLAASRAWVFFDRTLKASTTMHNEMVVAVMRSPLRFFHTNPTGRVLNRFSRDLGLVDDMLPPVLMDTLQQSFIIVGALVLVVVAAWPAIIVLIPLCVAFFWYRRMYVRTSREVKRLEAVSRSPVYASFSAMMKGLPTVRAYRVQDFFHSTFTEHQNVNTSWYFCFNASVRWIGLRMDMMSVLTLLGISAGAMFLRHSLSLALLGVALINTLELSDLMQWTVRQSAEVENNMTATERLIEYTKLPREAATCSEGGESPPQGWPYLPAPELQFDNLTATYGPHLTPVLKGLSFNITAGTSCGIVGRTGSGKSSLLLSLFRLIDTVEGSLRISGTDVASIGVDALRRQLAIIPQEPVLFSGSLRFNLDPFEARSDASMWEVLRLVRLAEKASLLGGLDAVVSEGGENWSVGQRQLLCLARALLQDAAVFALDEATANVDRTTDAAIQSALRQVVTARRANGRKRTVLVIAHRIDTIMDCDSVVVLSRGEVAEIGAPRQLLAKPGGVFAGYVAAATAGGMACGIPALPDVNTTTNTNNNDDDEVTAAVADAQAEDTEAGDDRSTGNA